MVDFLQTAGLIVLGLSFVVVVLIALLVLIKDKDLRQGIAQVIRELRRKS